MQFENFFRARLLVKPVDVLGCDGYRDAVPFKVGERKVRGVGLCVEDLTGERPEPVEKLFRRCAEGVERCRLQRFIAGP